MMHLPIPIIGAQVVNEQGEEYGQIDHILIIDNTVYLVISDEEPEDGAKEPLPFKVVNNDSVL